MNALPPLITQHLEEVRALCEKYRVKRLTLFGSAVKGTFDEERSDLDLIVEFMPEADPIRYGRAYLDLWRDLKRLFGRKVDLVESTTIDNPYFVEAIHDSRVEIYRCGLRRKSRHGSGTSRIAARRSPSTSARILGNPQPHRLGDHPRRPPGPPPRSERSAP